jgi:CRP-like cAMP-binding protein
MPTTLNIFRGRSLKKKLFKPKKPKRDNEQQTTRTPQGQTNSTNSTLHHKSTPSKMSFVHLFLASLEATPEQLEELSRCVRVKNVAKGEILTRKGELTAKSYFVKKGCLRCYSIDEKGKEHIFMFAPEGWLASDITTQLKNVPSDLFIDALEDSEIEVLDLRAAEAAGFDSRQLFGMGTEKLVNRIAVLQKRIIMLMSASAWERYEHFLDTYPNIVQRVPQRMIASYLGITPEALSKLRGDKAKK